jgi:hypothetical protein
MNSLFFRSARTTHLSEPMPVRILAADRRASIRTRGIGLAAHQGLQCNNLPGRH